MRLRAIQGESVPHQRFGTYVLITWLASGCLLLLSSCASSRRAPITYTVTPDKAAAPVSYQAQGGDITLEIHSESGIGSTQFAQAAGGAVTSLTLRLYLKGLEELRFQYANVTVTAHVSSQDTAVSETVTLGSDPTGPQQDIDSKSPYWMAVNIVAADTSIPLQDGYFEVQAPKDCLNSAARAFTVSWVDFYR